MSPKIEVVGSRVKERGGEEVLAGMAGRRGPNPKGDLLYNKVLEEKTEGGDALVSSSG